ncbi:hypothetical protein L249_7555 [Ophiocordyceps polyrhachis-furcata BCC 54312]|uniref:Uncharacterized protein n=1 Tax=Ophiocordyceps polyrhachis-furcata BCC 54312 TaxID=1330021 RepID=A0A367LBQ9_9HYPO|nr:hypothetical protein L249_7555 [Ophiocordyceps polyrhachis-furcata BCC 54312]
MTQRKYFFRCADIHKITSGPKKLSDNEAEKRAVVGSHRSISLTSVISLSFVSYERARPIAAASACFGAIAILPRASAPSVHISLPYPIFIRSNEIQAKE